jgi:hypothetical protein
MLPLRLRLTDTVRVNDTVMLRVKGNVLGIGLTDRVKGLVVAIAV